MSSALENALRAAKGYLLNAIIDLETGTKKATTLATLHGGVKMIDEALGVIDPREPDPSREGIFRDHNCWRCQNGSRPCVNGNPNSCENPHARND